MRGSRSVAYLLPHFPQALQTMEQVAAPQQLAAKERTWAIVSHEEVTKGEAVEAAGRTVPRLGTASSGIERRAPMAAEGARWAAQAGVGGVCGRALAAVRVGDNDGVPRIRMAVMGAMGVVRAVDGGMYVGRG